MHEQLIMNEINSLVDRLAAAETRNIEQGIFITELEGNAKSLQSQIETWKECEANATRFSRELIQFLEGGSPDPYLGHSKWHADRLRELLTNAPDIVERLAEALRRSQTLLVSSRSLGEWDKRLVGCMENNERVMREYIGPEKADAMIAELALRLHTGP